MPEAKPRQLVKLARHPRPRPPESLREPVLLDGRTRLARDAATLREQLVAHVGGRPSAVEGALIEAVIQLRLRLTDMDTRFAETGTMSEHDAKTYLAWLNSYGRALLRLGLKGTPQKGPSFVEHLADLAARKAAGATQDRGGAVR